MFFLNCTKILTIIKIFIEKLQGVSVVSSIDRTLAIREAFTIWIGRIPNQMFVNLRTLESVDQHFLRT